MHYKSPAALQLYFAQPEGMALGLVYYALHLQEGRELKISPAMWPTFAIVFLVSFFFLHFSQNPIQLPKNLQKDLQVCMICKV